MSSFFVYWLRSSVPPPEVDEGDVYVGGHTMRSESMRSEGGNRKDGGGSLASSQLWWNSKTWGGMERWLLCIINQKKQKKRESGSAFLDRADCIYAEMEATGERH